MGKNRLYVFSGGPKNGWAVSLDLEKIEKEGGELVWNVPGLPSGTFNYVMTGHLDSQGREILEFDAIEYD